jgi:Zn-dependent oligopeptidase
LKQSQKEGVGLFYSRQVYLGLVDFTFQNKYDSLKGIDLNQVSANYFKLMGIPFPEENHFIYSFTHLTSYAAQYYGYLWSRIIAQDLFTEFKRNGVMDQKTGIAYRKEILEKGATVEESDMVKKFLGREPNAKAFLEELK